MSIADDPRPGRGELLVMYLDAVPGICILMGLGRRIAAGARSATVARPGSRTGPLHALVDAPAATVYGMMTRFDGDGDAQAAGAIVRLADGAVIRGFETPVRLPFGMQRVVRTREEIRLVSPASITFRHLAGPVRGMAELIVVEPQGEARCRVTYTGVLPHSGPVLRVAYRLLARPAIERIVRAHLADLAHRAEGDGAARGEDRRLSDGSVAGR